MIDRETCLRWIQAARLTGRVDFARSLASEWLTAWPGDQEVRLWLARFDMELGDDPSAATRLRKVIEADPERVEAYELIGDALQRMGEHLQADLYRACASALKGGSPESSDAATWARALARSRRVLEEGDHQEAFHAAQEALLADLDLPLALWTAVRAKQAAGELEAAAGMARVGLNRWPDCVPLRLIAALGQIQAEDRAQGVASLHRAASGDPSGRLTTQILGEDHPYRALWPAPLEAEIDRPLPAAVREVLGENRITDQGWEWMDIPDSTEAEASLAPLLEDLKTPIPASATVEELGQLNDAELPTPEPWEAFRGPDPGPDGDSEETYVDDPVWDDLGQIAARWNARRRRDDEDGRAPAYVILSSRTRLAQVLGFDRAAWVDEAASALAAAVQKRPGWNAYKVYIDDPGCLEPFGLPPADPGNPWQIKLRVGDLDHQLGSRGEMIGALLILGGPAIVPFHWLPNPTDDVDSHVPSDNPYAATDENYFAPEWPVGRIPVDGDADQLVRILRGAADHHLDMAEPVGPIFRLRHWLEKLYRLVLGVQPNALGYSASLWRKASMSVFRAIGEPKGLLTSPPVDAATLPSSAYRPVRLSYFNLHGIEDGPEWFGQRDPLSDPTALQEFPIALRPEDIANGGRAPLVVFSEACYGASVEGKTSATAICLKFLESGSRAVIGSTKISYGSLTPPLLAADLLGSLFWEHLNQNLPTGEALRRAKLELAARMHRRQGYLDGEDQKAIISFVHYGDPLFTPRYEPLSPGRKTVLRRTTRPTRMKTACALGGPALSPEDLDPLAREKVSSIVARYLPGMQGAECTVHAQRSGCEGGDHACPTHELGVTSSAKGGQGSFVVTFSKQVDVDSRAHNRFARLTMDNEGRVLKLAISR